jgi:hypothetical protein
MRPALVLLLALSTATAAPLPFPKPEALKAIQGDWTPRMLVADGFDPGRPRLSVSVDGDRLTMYQGGKPASEWTVSPDPKYLKGGLALRLTTRATGMGVRTGGYSIEEDRLILYLAPEDIGEITPAVPFGHPQPRLTLGLRRAR